MRPADTPGERAALAWMDGAIVPAAEATVPLLDDGVLRGDAVFEAMLVRGGRTHARDRHLARLQRSADALDLELPPVRDVLADLLAAWGDDDGALRLIVMRGGTVRAIVGRVSWPASIALAAVEMPWRTAISGVKTLSYATNQWALRRAKQDGGDDALIVDGGVVHELPTGAVCLVHDGRVSTPDPDRLPILRSVTVECLGEVVPIERTVPRRDDLRQADEVFVLSATRPILPVHALLVDGERFALPAGGPVTTQLKAAFDAAIAASLD
jgi:branched-chain amino acid aminotransferase